MLVTRVVRFVAAVMSATLAALAATPKLLWEGGKWVLRSLFPPPAADQAEAELVEEVEDAVAAVETNAAVTASVAKADIGPDFHQNLGRAALQHLIPLEGDDPVIGAMLDDQDRAYLDSLPRDRLALLVNYRPTQIGLHLMREVPIATMPRVPSYQEYTQSLYDRLAAEGHTPNPRIVRAIRRADIDESEDAVRLAYGR